MKLADATILAEELKHAFEPCCDKVTIAGSIRRRMPEINDIDLVIVPYDLAAFDASVKFLLDNMSLNGKKIKRGTYKGMTADLYIADANTYDTLLLIRTGSAEHNIRLTTLAKHRGYKLHANGTGLENQFGVIIAKTEQEIFRALDISYLEPEERHFPVQAEVKST